MTLRHFPHSSAIASWIDTNSSCSLEQWLKDDRRKLRCALGNRAFQHIQAGNVAGGTPSAACTDSAGIDGNAWEKERSVCLAINSNTTHAHRADSITMICVRDGEEGGLARLRWVGLLPVLESDFQGNLHGSRTCI